MPVINRADLEFQPADFEDIPVIYSMCKELIDMYEDISQINYERVLQWVQEKLNRNITCYSCVYHKGVKVGFFHLLTLKDQAELDDVYILPQYRGMGIGTNVLEALILQTKQPIFLYVFKKNLGAIRLYERMGFRISEEVGKTRLIMRRAVDSAF